MPVLLVRGSRCIALAALLSLCAVSVAAAQVVSPTVQPGRERERFTEPPVPRAQPGGAPIALPSTTAPREARSVTLVIRRVQIVGSTVYRDADFAPLYQDLIGRQVTLQAVYDLAHAITAKYGADGYVLSRAIVPEQELDPGGATVRIEVVEGYIDRVVWPAKLSRYRDFFSDYAAKITAERPINIRTLERYLLLASDLPGLKFTTTLKASAVNKGAATLIVEVTEKPVDGLARADNRGTRARGPLQFLISPVINNLMGQHESIALTYAAVSQPKELQYVAAAWRQVLNSEGLIGFVNVSYSWSYPGTADLEALDFRTRATYAEAGASFPVIRARERNLVVTGLAFMGENYSFWNVTPQDPQAVDRLRGARLRIEGDYADRLGGINLFNATYSQGIAGAGSTDNDNILASRRGGRIDFSKIEALASRMQPLVAPFSALVVAYGQYAFTPLLVPEQCGYGGRLFGRAFDPSELIADHCWMASFELRYDVPPGNGAPLKAGINPLPALQFYGFTDTGELYRVAIGSVGTAAATFSATSAGGGIRLWWQDELNVDLSAAKAIEGPRDGWRFFFIATVRY
jgi:hemolysin activation/secretion protein